MKVSSFLPRRLPGFLLPLLACLCAPVWAAPYGSEGLETEWTQPDGTKLVLRVFGDEFYARTETLDGYTVVYHPADQSYRYADLAVDGESFVPSDREAHREAPAGQVRHLALPRAVVREKRFAMIDRYAPDRAKNWQKRVQAVRRQRAIEGGLLPAPAPGDAAAQAAAEEQQILAAPVNGAKVGLTILVQFPDDPNTGGNDPTNFPTTQAKIDNYCNQVGYSDDGNTGSVRDYFSDQSLGALTYTQAVTPIVTLPNARNYYNYSDYPTNATLRNSGDAGRQIIQHAIAELQTLGFDFTTLSLDGSDRVIATSVLFAGSTSGVWSDGLWPHSWSMPYPGINVGTGGNDRYIYCYQITNAADAAPKIGTFIHENGHMLLGLPDLYDYDPPPDDSEGVGEHCLMGSGNHNNGGRTPATLNGYFKDVVGWANIVDYTSGQVANVSIPTTGNVAYRIRKPGTPSEYFLVENHGTGDKWANSLPDKGIVIWHIDEDKDDNDEEQMTSALHYQVSLEQADGLFDLENGNDRGDGQDLFDSGDGSFTDLTTPNAHWWDGSASGIMIDVASAVGANMNVQFGDAINLTSPNGGEVVHHGNVVAVAWDASTAGDVKIELYKGGLLHTVLSASESNDGNYLWTVSAGLPVGTDYTIRISSVANSSLNDVSDAAFEIAAATLENALDTSGLTWTTGGGADWFLQTAVTHDGTDAAESGDISDNQTSEMQTTLSGPGTLSFWWMVSSETNYDFLRFYLDGVEQVGSLARISGAVPWVQKTVSIPAGNHAVKWAFTKDYSVSSLDDAGRVDQVVFMPTPKPEIVLEQPLGNDLADGGASIELGSLDLGADSGPVEFTVRNTGTGTLSGLAVTKEGAHAADFTVGSLGATSLAPAASTTFTVTFAPGSPGAKSAAIHLASNDADENPFDISLTGYGRSPVESWRFAKYGTTDNTGNAGNFANPDGDDYPNLMEYAFKLDTTLDDPNPLSRDMVGSEVFLIYPRNTAATDLTFTVEESGDLGLADAWAPATVVEQVLGTTGGVDTVKATRTLLPGEDQLFLRLKISLTP